MAEKRDYYEVLGIQKGASEDEIKKAYKKLCLTAISALPTLTTTALLPWPMLCSSCVQHCNLADCRINVLLS